MQIKKPLRILFSLLLLVVILCSIASIPISALYGFYGGQTDDPILFYPQINVIDRVHSPSSNLIQPTISFLNFTGSTTNGWQPTATGSINATYFVSDEEDGVYTWDYMSTWREDGNANTGLSTATTRLRIANDVSTVNIYDVIFYQDVIYIPFKYIDPSTGSYDPGIVDAWSKFYISIIKSATSVTLNVQDVDIDYSVWAPQMVSNSSSSGGSLTATDVKLFNVNDLVDYRYLFTASLYEDVCNVMRDERDMRNTKWLAIRDFKVTCLVNISSTSTPLNTRMYIDVKQPLNYDMGNGVIYDLTTFRSDDYFSHLKGYYSSEGGGAVSPPSQDSSFTDWIVNVIDSFFGVKLFGSFGLGDLMWFVVGVGVLFAVLKIFAGG